MPEKKIDMYARENGGEMPHTKKFADILVLDTTCPRVSVHLNAVLSF